ncbi:tetratricopeptide repeat protein [Candidatus Uhrbacteria bacterium]|nr:tetratricopeptide repeat protein [Candidatus Uhrbacteria bacterium]
MTYGLSDHLRAAARGLMYALVFFLPLTVLPLTLEPLEISKQTLLSLATLCAALLWLASMLTEKKIRFARGWVSVIPSLYVAAFAIPALSSVAPYLSFVGAHRQEYTSVLTAVSVGVLIILISQTFRERKSHKLMHATLLLSTAVAIALALLALFGISIFGSATSSFSFNSVGTLTSFATFLIVMTSFFLASFLCHHPGDSMLHEGAWGRAQRGVIFLVALCTFFFLLLLDQDVLWLLFILSLLSLFVFVFFRAQDFPHRARLLIPLILILAALPFWFWLRGLNLPQVPLEVTLNTDSSLTIAQKTLQAYSSTVGSGPGTYLYDFSRFRDVRLNETDFWDTRFDRASSHALTLVPTIGVLGITLLSLFVLFLLVGAIQQALRPRSRAQWLESFVHVTPWLVLVMSALLIPWNMTLTALFAIFSGLLASQLTSRETSRSFDRSPASALLCSFLFLCAAFVLLVGVFMTTQRYAAEVAFTQAVETDRADGSLQDVVALLDRAVMLNRFHDTYSRNLSEALLLRVQEELTRAGSVQGLSPEGAQYVQALVAASVNAATQATTLSPNNVLNWLTRGSVYRELIPLMGEASEFAVASYARATELESVNPSNWTQLGKTYLTTAQAAQEQESRAALLEQAQAALARAIELKPNYAPAHFELALTYAAAGRLDDAIAKMESVALYNPLDVGVAFQLGALYVQRGGEGDRAKAQAAFERAIELSPEYSNAHWFLASIYEGEGDLAAAVREVETVLRLNPGNVLVEARLEKLLAGQVSQEMPVTIE